MSFLNADLFSDPTVVDSPSKASTTHNATPFTGSALHQQRRFSYSDVTQTSSFFDNDYAGDEMETTVAAEEIQRHWRGKKERLRHAQALHQQHEQEFVQHQEYAAAHTEEGFAMLEQTQRKQAEMDQAILNRSKQRNQQRQTNAAKPAAYHQSNELTLSNDQIELLLSRFRTCLAVLCAKTKQTPFDLFDINRDGMITRGEFRRAVIDFDFALNETEMNHLIHFLDANNNGTIDMTEWVSQGLNLNRGDRSSAVGKEGLLSAADQRALNQHHTNTASEKATVAIQRVYRGNLGRLRSVERMHEQYQEQQTILQQQREAMMHDWENSQRTGSGGTGHGGAGHGGTGSVVHTKKASFQSPESNPIVSPFHEAFGLGKIVAGTGLPATKHHKSIGVTVSPTAISNTNNHPNRNNNTGIIIENVEMRSTNKMDLQHREDPEIKDDAIRRPVKPVRPVGLSPSAHNRSNGTSRAAKVNTAARNMVEDVMKQSLISIATPLK